MAVELSELEELRDALIRARASGTRTVSFGDRRVEYASDTEMAAALADLDRRIRAASIPRPAAVVFTSSKGV